MDSNSSCNGTCEHNVNEFSAIDLVNADEEFLLVVPTEVKRLEGYLFATLSDKDGWRDWMSTPSEPSTAWGNGILETGEEDVADWWKDENRCSGLRRKNVGCRERRGKVEGKYGKACARIGNKEKAAVFGSLLQYKFEANEPIISHIHHDIETNPDWLYEVVQIIETEL